MDASGYMSTINGARDEINTIYDDVAKRFPDNVAAAKGANVISHDLSKQYNVHQIVQAHTRINQIADIANAEHGFNEAIKSARDISDVDIALAAYIRIAGDNERIRNAADAQKNAIMRQNTDIAIGQIAAATTNGQLNTYVTKFKYPDTPYHDEVKQAANGRVTAEKERITASIDKATTIDELNAIISNIGISYILSNDDRLQLTVSASSKKNRISNPAAEIGGGSASRPAVSPVTITKEEKQKIDDELILRPADLLKNKSDLAKVRKFLIEKKMVTSDADKEYIRDALKRYIETLNEDRAKRQFDKTSENLVIVDGQKPPSKKNKVTVVKDLTPSDLNLILERMKGGTRRRSRKSKGKTTRRRRSKPS
jgi:hypothetical protein